MTDENTANMEREPGWYHVKRYDEEIISDSAWVPEYYTGRDWKPCNDKTWTYANPPTVIGPRIVEPK